MKLIPELASDGINSILIFLPVCKPMPTAFIEFLSVLCFNIYAVLILLTILSQLQLKH